jgi:hypothetical protein
MGSGTVLPCGAGRGDQRAPLAWHDLWVSHYEGASGFGCLAEHAGRERQEEVKKKKQKIIFPCYTSRERRRRNSVAHNNTVLLLFLFFLFLFYFYFLCGTQKWVTTCNLMIVIESNSLKLYLNLQGFFS